MKHCWHPLEKDKNSKSKVDLMCCKCRGHKMAYIPQKDEKKKWLRMKLIVTSGDGKFPLNLKKELLEALAILDPEWKPTYRKIQLRLEA